MSLVIRHVNSAQNMEMKQIISVLNANLNLNLKMII